MFLNRKEWLSLSQPIALASIILLFIVPLVFAEYIGEVKLLSAIIMFVTLFSGFMISIFYNHIHDWKSGMDKKEGREQAELFFENEELIIKKSYNTIKLLCAILIMCGIYIVLTSNYPWVIIMFILFSLIITFGYSNYLHLAKLPISEIINAFFLSTFLYTFVGLVLEVNIIDMIIFSIPTFFLALAAAITANALDIEQDKGHRNTGAMVLGEEWSKIISFITVSISMTIFIIYIIIGFLPKEILLSLVIPLFFTKKIIENYKLDFDYKNKPMIMNNFGKISIVVNSSLIIMFIISIVK